MFHEVQSIDWVVLLWLCTPFLYYGCALIFYFLQRLKELRTEKERIERKNKVIDV